LRTNTRPITGAGRWGTSCAPAGDGSQIVFAGGKYWPKMAKEVYILPAPTKIVRGWPKLRNLAQHFV
jgi:hypothetical protein